MEMKKTAAKKTAAKKIASDIILYYLLQNLKRNQNLIIYVIWLTVILMKK